MCGGPVGSDADGRDVAHMHRVLGLRAEINEAADTCDLALEGPDREIKVYLPSVVCSPVSLSAPVWMNEGGFVRITWVAPFKSAR